MSESIGEKGKISVHTENIFPIIKKFLYSDQEVFLRELVANAVDATEKLKKLAAMGIYNEDITNPQIKVIVNKKLKTITIQDQGLGMTLEEVKKYINQIAFSGAEEFLEKYKDKDTKQLIGCFGLGVYSAFMVASKMEIITRSYQEGAEPVRWVCDGSTSFELTPTVKKDIGTDVILHISEDAETFLNSDILQGILKKYCKFLPVPIQFNDQIINTTPPLWTRSPSELTDKDYKEFYKQLYPGSQEPLFWIHLNVDYPFNLTGILYFPPITEGVEVYQSKIQLYVRQVFITDEVKGVVPEFLMLLHGIMDSPDIPLNVSRSALLSNSRVKKINTYITKKVADKLEELFRSDRAEYEKIWDDLALFVKYGMLTDDKFRERARHLVLLKNIKGERELLGTYIDKVKNTQTNRDKKTVLLYSTHPDRQRVYIDACQQRGYCILVMDHPIDQHFIGLLEQKLFENIVCKGVDTDPVHELIVKSDSSKYQEVVLTEKDKERLQTIYKEAVGSSDVESWSLVDMLPEEPPVVLTVPEFMQRMQCFIGKSMDEIIKAFINTQHPLSKKILQTKRKEKQNELALHAYRLACLGRGKLQGDSLIAFIEKSIVFMLD